MLMASMFEGLLKKKEGLLIKQKRRKQERQYINVNPLPQWMCFSTHVILS